MALLHTGNQKSLYRNDALVYPAHVPLFMLSKKQKATISQPKIAILIGQLNLGGAERQAKILFTKLNDSRETYLILKSSKINSTGKTVKKGGVLAEIEKSYLNRVIKLDEIQFKELKGINVNTRFTRIRKLLRTLRIKASKIFKNIVIIIRLRNQLKIHKIQCVYAFLPSSLILASIAKISSLQLLKETKIIMCKRGSIEHIKGIERTIYVNFARIFPKQYITNSIFLKNELIEAYRVDSHKIHVIRNSIDPKLSALMLNPPAKKRKKILQFVSVGNIKKVKNIDVIFGVMKALQEQGFIFKYIHIGEIRNLNVNEDNNDKQIQFLGSCTYSQTLQEMYNSDVFINFSQTEGAANALLEALCIGLPCILSDIPSNRELANSETRYCKTEKDLTETISKMIKTRSGITGVRERTKRGKKFMDFYNSQISKELDYLSISKID